MTRRTSETVHVDLARCTDLHALLMDTFEHRVFCAQSLLLLYKVVLIRAVNLHRDEKTQARNGERWEIVTQDSTGSAEYSRCTYV